MKKINFEDIEKEGLLLYRYRRGSHAYGTNVEGSDEDEGGVYMAPAEQLLGLGLDYQEEVCDAKNDKSWFELNKFMNLLIKSNPTMLESLFIDDEFVLYESPIIKYLKEHKEVFLTKDCFIPFIAYASSQIKKAKNLNKMINYKEEDMKKKSLLDFCYTTYKQGSTKIYNWLEYRGMKQKYCGLVCIPNMKDYFGVYYDWGTHFKEEGINVASLFSEYKDKKDSPLSHMVYFIMDFYGLHDDNYFVEETIFNNWFDSQIPIGYRGIMKEDADDTTEVRLSSVPDKNAVPICYINYNKDGFSVSRKKYKEFCEWQQNRNPVRYELNKDKSYDAKNMMHSFRLINMGIEIAEGKGFNVNRRNIDREFLLDIRNHKYEYDELIEKLEERRQYLEKAIESCTLPETINIDKVNDLVLNIRKKQIMGEK